MNIYQHIHYRENIHYLFKYTFLGFFMKRKVIKQGHNTLTVTLPSKWVKNFNVLQGQEIDIFERDNGLFMTTKKSNSYEKIEIDITGMDIPTIWKNFMSAYREGYDEILVKFPPKLKMESPYKHFTRHAFDEKYNRPKKLESCYDMISDIVDRFIGYEIVEQGEDQVVVKSMGKVTDKEFDSSLRRIFLILDQMAEQTLDSITKKNPKIVSNTHDIDISLDKFTDYCIRVLNKTGGREKQKTHILFSILFMLELLADEFKNIANHFLQDFPKKSFDNLEKSMEGIKKEIALYQELFYHFDKDKVMEIADLDRSIYFQFHKLYQKSNEGEKEVFNHLRRISRYINSLMELRIEMEY